MAIDGKRLRRDARKAETERPPRSVGRTTTGALVAVEENLDLIRRMRGDGVRWAAIAEALSMQGVHRMVDGEPRPLTATRLTALVHAIEKRAERTAARRMQRAARSGLVDGPSGKAAPDPTTPAGDGKVAPSPTRPVVLSPDLQPGPNASRARDGTHASEEDLRRDALNAVRGLMKD